jgi:hypothetical protein
MNWEKKGLIFVPDGSFDWSVTHAQVPVIDILDDRIWRIYYATRGTDNRSRTGYIEVQAHKPENILYIKPEPILVFGRPGAFDEDGIMPSSLLTIGDKKYLYYIGWSQRKNVPYQNSIGLAISSDGGRSFQKYSEGPIIGVNHIDPFFTGTINVIKDGNLFRGYYLSCLGWKMVNERLESTYVLKYAESADGINWQRTGRVAIPFKNQEEGGIVSAAVIKRENKYLMWFGYRKYYDFRANPANSYRIGFAESEDGLNWLRDDSLSGIDVSESGWDCEMISYPYVIGSKGQLYMFYNGNNFGKTGMGYAILNL